MKEVRIFYLIYSYKANEKIKYSIFGLLKEIEVFIPLLLKLRVDVACFVL